MALTKIGTDSIKDDAVTSVKIPANAVGSSEIAANSVTLAKMAGGTDGQIITYDASGDPVAVGPGTDGQVLTSTGAGSPPAFEAIPAGGKILQVQSVTKTSVFTTTSGSFTDITGLSVSITPAASSKVLVLGACQYSSSGSGGNRQHIRLVRDSTAIAIGDAASNRSQSTFSSETSGGGGNMKNAALFYLDTHGANGSTAVTYKFQAGALDGATFQLNQSVYDTDSSSYPRVASFLTVLEVAA